MEKLNLRKYFDSIIAKRLSEVEVAPKKSNQHEFNATSAMKYLFGKEKKKYETKFIYLCDEEEPVTCLAFMTWYDAREHNPLRSEYRLFYNSTPVSRLAAPGDCLFLCKLRDGTLLAVITKKDSMMEQRIRWLFGTKPANLFETGFLNANDASCEMIADTILGLIGVDVRDREDTELVVNLETVYGTRLPNFEQFCELARKRSGIEPDTQDADEALMSWMYCQEELVCAMRRYLQKLHEQETAEGSVDFGRMEKLINGKWQEEALRSHMRALLKAREIRFEVYSSGSQSFMLPGWKENHDGSYPAGRLSLIEFQTLMDDSNSTAVRDRTGAPVTHVITMDPGLTAERIAALEKRKIQPVIPSPVQKLYNGKNVFWFLSVEELLLLLTEKQEGRYGN